MLARERYLRLRKQRVEQIILMPDEGENTTPYFAQTYEAYKRDLMVEPGVLVVKVGYGCDWVERRLQEKQAQVDTFTFAVTILAATDFTAVSSITVGVADGDFRDTVARTG